MASLKSVMDKHFTHIQFNDQWCRKLTQYYYKLFTKDENTLAFFGDGLWGVYPIYFLPQDINIFYDDLLEVDDLSLKNEVHALEQIDPRWKVSSDIVNLTLMYLVHRLLTSDLEQAKKCKYSIFCLNILQFKFLSSMQKRKFPYGVKKEIAVAVFARLTRKFMIKVCGSWRELLEYRAKDIISEKSIHYKTIIFYEDTYAVMVMVNEIQNRAKKMVNVLTEEFYKAHSQDTSIAIKYNTITDEDGEAITENINQFKIYRKYIQSIIGDRQSLIKKDLIAIIEAQSARLPKSSLEQTLQFISDNSYGLESKRINEFLNDLLEYSFCVIAKSNLKSNQLAKIIIKLKSMFLSSRVTTEKLMKIKDNLTKIIQKKDKFNSMATLVTLRTALMLYFVLRTLLMNHYS